MPSSRRYDFALVGGGLVGACVAEELAVAGASVLVIDSGAEPGHATPQAAGVAVPSLRFVADQRFYRWLLAARAALEEDLLRLEPRHGSFSLTRPIVRLLTESDLAVLPAGAGAEVIGRSVSTEELTRLAPGLRLPADRRPFRAEHGLVLNGRAYLSAVRAAGMSAGVEWQQRRDVVAIEEEPDRALVRCADGATHTADRVVVTAGAWTGQLVTVPIVPQRGQLVLLDSDVPLDCILSSRLYLAPLPGGGMLVGATEEDAGFVARSTAASVAGVLAFAIRMVPALAAATVVESRAGLRPVSGSGRPLVGRVPGRQRVYAAAGHAGHGLISARLTARGLAAGLVFGDWDELPEEFCPGTELVGAAVSSAGSAGHRNEQ